MKMHCRILTLVLVAISLICGITIVAKAESDSVSNVPTFTFTNEAENLYEEFYFSEIPSDEEAIRAYRMEVNRRHGLEIETGRFLPEEEEIFLERLGYNVLTVGKIVHDYDRKYGDITAFEFPVLYEGPNGVELWYTAPNGDLRATAVVGRLSNGGSWRNYGNIHYLQDGEAEMFLKTCMYYTITYDNHYGTVSIWEYGKLTRKHFLPEDSIYAGFSENEGFIFRCGSDVYAVRDYGCFTQRYGVQLIARNVNFVIATDYEGDGSEDLSQPLFLMEDGSIRFYCTWYNDNDVPADDDSNLIDVRFERGFNL